MSYAIRHSVSRQIIAIRSSYQDAVEYVDGSPLYLIESL